MTRTADQAWEAITAAIDHDDEANFRFGERVEWETCSACDGSGDGMYEGVRCSRCQGRGSVPVEVCDAE